MSFRLSLLAGAACMLGVILLITVPEEAPPSIWWRLHFGNAEWLLGLAFGAHIGTLRWFKADAAGEGRSGG